VEYREQARSAPLGCITAGKYSAPIVGGWTVAAKTNKGLTGCVREAWHSLAGRRSSQSEGAIRFALAGSASVSWQSGVLLMKSGTAGTSNRPSRGYRRGLEVQGDEVAAEGGSLAENDQRAAAGERTHDGRRGGFGPTIGALLPYRENSRLAGCCSPIRYLQLG
jgi:hypothetical protein